MLVLLDIASWVEVALHLSWRRNRTPRPCSYIGAIPDLRNKDGDRHGGVHKDGDRDGQGERHQNGRRDGHGCGHGAIGMEMAWK